MSKLKKVILGALLLSLLVVLSRFLSIKTQLLVISLSFIPIMMSAIWLGPGYSCLIALLGDLIGAILFPFGTYFWGYTFGQALVGLIFGLFLHNKGRALSNMQLIIRLIISSIIVCIGINIFLTSLWLHIQYGKGYLVVVASRAVAQLIMIPIQVISIFSLEKFSRPIFEKYLINEEEKDED